MGMNKNFIHLIKGLNNQDGDEQELYTFDQGS